jgi:transglutaminase-like putative cysteine protease
MRLNIRYSTRFSYDGRVRESANELRACPVSDHRQQLRSYRVTTNPSSRVLSSTDYWGNRVDAFQIRAPHTSLEIIAEATVETYPTPVLTASPRMAAVRDDQFRSAHLEYLEPSAHTTSNGVVAHEARRRADAVGDDVIGVALAMHRTVGTSLTYTPGATYVGVTVDEVLGTGHGVCQDFAHLVIAMCRSVGIPARYVSGYFFARDDATGERPDDDDVVVVQTHAWLEVAVPGAGWLALDPTNQLEVGPRHVKIGHGRDYDDVSPLRGVFSGPAAHDLDVQVEMRRSAMQQQTQQ